MADEAKVCRLCKLLVGHRKGFSSDAGPLCLDCLLLRLGIQSFLVRARPERNVWTLRIEQLMVKILEAVDEGSL